MKYIGAHVSTSGGPERAPQNAENIGAKAFAMFTRNQRRWISKPRTDKVLETPDPSIWEEEIRLLYGLIE